MILSCPTCGATWPSDRSPDDPVPLCPICAGVEPNAGGSPSGPEAEDELLLHGDA